VNIPIDPIPRRLVVWRGRRAASFINEYEEGKNVEGGKSSCGPR
jgi:hypothetical protein